MCKLKLFYRNISHCDSFQNENERVKNEANNK